MAFFAFMFLGKNNLEKMCGIFSIEKKHCLSIKIVSLDSRIFAYFPKGLTHDFGPKNGSFFILCFWTKTILK